ncbi:hypothetical protein [Polycladidibacter stylochi]|uniref:hypothetical protein n=1 Tax=Polycladidibacter stylochi TaxID=1807766 RepID=UPI00082D4DA6|nr:hypothetical protein [Pseudovibrio stylochi]
MTRSTHEKPTKAEQQRITNTGESLKSTELDVGLLEEAKKITMEQAPEVVSEVLHDAEAAIEEKVIDAEEKIEVAAGRSVWGGPVGWGMLALAAVLAVYLLLTA